jgi:hypothetical protein
MSKNMMIREKKTSPWQIGGEIQHALHSGSIVLQKALQQTIQSNDVIILFTRNQAKVSLLHTTPRNINAP